MLAGYFNTIRPITACHDDILFLAGLVNLVLQAGDLIFRHLRLAPSLKQPTSLDETVFSGSHFPHIF